MTNTTGELFKALWQAHDEGRLAFEIGRHPKRRGKWLLFRCSVQCLETGHFDSLAEAMAWGDSLTRRRPVKWTMARN